ncbi:acyl-CoA N-acyltransferase [Mycena floridula]|nr:acyl-CoA N-acyltransferase [Mycena floridula]
MSPRVVTQSEFQAEFSLVKDKETQLLDRRSGESSVRFVAAATQSSVPQLDLQPPRSVQDVQQPKSKARKRKRPVSDDTPEPGPSRIHSPSKAIELNGKKPADEPSDGLKHRKFDLVVFGAYSIKPWYASPYPLDEPDIASGSGSRAKTPARSLQAAANGGSATPDGEKSFLWVCQFCFRYHYSTELQAWELHQKSCTKKCPPGTKVYCAGPHTIWRVDGKASPLYCQNLSMFGKLFLEVKTLFFDVSNFDFYILTETTSTGDHVLGYFSKEKVTYDDYNLATIITLPPYQRKGYGTLMIEFSYELSRRAGKIGSPEGPLSDLGLRSYLSFWVATLIRFFRRVLTLLPPGQLVISRGTPPNPRNLLPERQQPERDANLPAEEERHFPIPDTDDPLASLKTYVTRVMEDGSLSVHMLLRCELKDISRAACLKEIDAAFALNEVELLAQKEFVSNQNSIFPQYPANQHCVIITREKIEQIANIRKIKESSFKPEFAFPSPGS